MLTKTQVIRGLVTESSSDSRNWEFWGNYEGTGSRVQGALLRALNVWWLNFKDDLNLGPQLHAPHKIVEGVITAENNESPHYGNSPVVLPASNY